MMTIASANNENWRTEKDALGEVRVPAEHLWGAQTERSRLNFVIGVERHRWGRSICTCGWALLVSSRLWVVCCGLGEEFQRHGAIGANIGNLQRR